MPGKIPMQIKPKSEISKVGFETCMNSNDNGSKSFSKTT